MVFWGVNCGFLLFCVFLIFFIVFCSFLVSFFLGGKRVVFRFFVLFFKVFSVQSLKQEAHRDNRE